MLKKFLKWLIITVCVVLLIDAALVFGFASYQPSIEKADAIIVLGAAINSPALIHRSLEGLRLYEAGKADVLVLSGGRISDEDITEAEFMKSIILKNTQISPQIILEENSNSTYDNIKNSKALLPQTQSLIIVTDKYHLARSVLLAKQKFNKVYWSSPDSGYYNTAANLAYHYGREMLAMIFYIPKFIH